MQIFRTREALADHIRRGRRSVEYRIKAYKMDDKRAKEVRKIMRDYYVRLIREWKKEHKV